MPTAPRREGVTITGRLDVRDLRKRFGDNPVLRGVSLSVEAGESLVILGPSGCGKSVLLKHLVGLLTPDAGDIRYDDVSLRSLSESALNALRTQLGMVFQGAALFDSLTVAENVAFPLRRHRRLDEQAVRDVVREKLDQVGLAGSEPLMPSELSGGMRKRVGIARALALQPKIIFYDEPTAGLDPVTARTVDGVIEKLQRERHATSIVVTHDLVTAFTVADRMAVMQRGAFVAMGTAAEIRASADPDVREFLRAGALLPAQDPGGPEAER
jgi:phospholipid/cholesterol/gamma-HCH transport system ATP-binding protein